MWDICQPVGESSSRCTSDAQHCFCLNQRAKQQKKKKKKKRQAQGDTEEEEVEEEDDDDNQGASEPEGAGDMGPPKPKPPEKPDLHSIEQWVREKASRIRRKPGEPVLVPELSASGTITASDLCPRCQSVAARFQTTGQREF